MKERELEELFRDAADTAPPATFDEQDIARGSRRVTARRRMAVAGGSLVAAGVLAVGVGAGTGMWTSEVDQRAGPPQQQRDANQQQNPRGGGGADGPTVLTLPGAGGGCGKPDPELASALNRQLPSVSPTTTPISATSCPNGSRTAAFHVRQEGTSGKVSAIVSPIGSVNPELREPGTSRRPDGTLQVTTRTDSGRVLIVRSKPGPGSAPPQEGGLTEIADTVAARF